MNKHGISNAYGVKFYMGLPALMSCSTGIPGLGVKGSIEAWKHVPSLSPPLSQSLRGGLGARYVFGSRRGYS